MQKINLKCLVVLFNFLLILLIPFYSFSNIYEHEVKKGDTLSKIIKLSGVSASESVNAIMAMEKIFKPSRIKIGDKVTISYSTVRNNEGQKKLLVGIDIYPTKLDKIVVRREGEKSFSAKRVTIPTSIRLAKASAKINTTFFGATRKAGIPYEVGSDFVRKYSYDVDFQRDIRKGNNIDVLYEEIVTLNGEVVGSGDIVYANLDLNNSSYPIYRFRTLDGRYGYFNEDGESIEKSFLRTPVDGARITSGFGKRRHPILGYNKMHKGLDFGAPRGTPIYAAGSGNIIKIGRNGSYGKYIKINHNNGYSTAYAHLNSFKRGLRKGSRVKQGQVIGYVGTTGRSTGPHLHYEVLKFGRHINPLSIKTVSTRKLKSLEMGIYKQHVKMVKNQLDKVGDKNKVAVLEVN
jgi:murein DD-endopeptidase MepM/ murein hydrolase activator NlpD